MLAIALIYLTSCTLVSFQKMRDSRGIKSGICFGDKFFCCLEFTGKNQAQPDTAFAK
jgi:hypothetical protein